MQLSAISPPLWQRVGSYARLTPFVASFCLGALLSAPTAALAAPPAPALVAQADDAPPTATIPPGIAGNLELVNVLEELVDHQFIYPAPASKHFNGAVDGLENALKEKKLPPMALAKSQQSASREEAFKVFSADYREVAAKHPELLKDNYLQTLSIRGMLKVLDDPYTVYLDKREYQNLQEAMNGGDFGGLGVYIQLDKDNGNALTVDKAIDDTPASRADLRPKDVILAVDGKPTKGTDPDGASKLLRGPIGSKVVLTIQRPKVDKPFDVTLERDRIVVSTVNHQMVERDGHKLGYLRLSIFGEHTDSEMESAIRDLEAKGAEGFILDLRNNGGGYINAAVDVCSKFLPTGSKVVSVEERGQTAITSRSHPNIHPSEPLVMLVNEYSASASEITAGAMKDLGRAKLVGVKTFGKGSVQKIYPLPDKTAIKITVAHYHTPSGKDINKLGIDPDVKVQMAAQDVGTGLKQDVQLDQALTILESEVAPAKTSQALPGTTIVRSSSEEVSFLDHERSRGFKVVSRKFIRQQDRLIEEVELQNSGGSKTLRLDVSSFLQ